MTWITSSGIHFRQPTRLPYTENDNKQITTFLLCNICYGICWNPNGRKYLQKSQGVGWVWGSPNSKILIDYINGLWGHNIVPIFYSEFSFDNFAQIVEEILSTLTYDPPIFMGCTVSKIKDIMAHTWITSPTVPQNVTKGLVLTGFPEITESNIYTIPKEKNDVLGYNLSDIGVDGPMSLVDWKGLIILVGQQGSGKSTIAQAYGAEGFYVANETEAGSLRRHQKRKTQDFIAQLEKIKTGTLKGIIIDSTNPTKDHRNVYIDLATQVGIKHIIGWVTRSGYYWNATRNVPIATIA
jgi:hypothetical protein